MAFHFSKMTATVTTPSEIPQKISIVDKATTNGTSPEDMARYAAYGGIFIRIY